MGSPSGLSQAVVDSTITDIIGGGADVRLFTTALAYDDTAADLDSKEISAADYAPVNVAEADWTVTFDATNDEAVLENAVQVDFGTAQNDWGTVVEAAVHASGTDQFIRSDEPNDPQITTGEEVRILSNALTFTIG